MPKFWKLSYFELQQVISVYENLPSDLLNNVDRHLVRDILDRIVPGHSEVAFWIIMYLDLHEIILRDQQSIFVVRHEETSALQNWNVPFIIGNFIVKVSLMGFLQGVKNTIHQVGME